MPGYYQQAVAAVALPDDVFGERPELPVPMVEPCFPASDCWLLSALLCDALFPQQSPRLLLCGTF